MGSRLHLKDDGRGEVAILPDEDMSGLIPWDQVVTWEGKVRTRALF